MEQQDESVETVEPQPGIGAQLRAAREAKGLTLEQVAAQTRIPQRHLQTIEAGDFTKLPGRTYAVGFSRTYAKTVDLDQDDVVAMVRAELDEQAGFDDPHLRPATFEPGDPARVPSRGLGWFAIFALLLFLAGGFFFFRAMFSPAGELPTLIDEDAEQAAAADPVAGTPQPPQGAIDPSGEVVFTALEEGIWVRFYDQTGRLMEKQMTRGEQYAVPAEARNPMLWTGRPDALSITIGGRAIPKLAETDMVMRDVPVTAEALLARQQPTPAPAGENPAVPAG